MDIIVDDTDPKIIYNTKFGKSLGLSWTPNYLCQFNCGNLDSLRGDVEAAALNGTWRTTRVAAGESNATFRFEGSSIAASFILFRRDIATVNSQSIRAAAQMHFYVDEELAQISNVSWSDISGKFSNRIGNHQSERFVPGVVLFNQSVTPGEHVLTVRYDNRREIRQQDASLALDFFAVGGEIPRPSSTVTSMYPTPTESSDVAPVAAGQNNVRARTALILVGVILSSFALLGALVLFWWRKRRARQRRLSRAVNLFFTPQMVDRPSIQGIPIMFDSAKPLRPSPPRSFSSMSSLTVFSRQGPDLQGFPPSLRPSTEKSIGPLLST